ncbi:MAG: hypothetical protein M0037_09135 [Betaproteobacteria bacterium]|nr:hypothetical protein [Betaproteobacteria bacterium]
MVRLLHHLYADPLNREALTAMAALAVLPSSWRELARQRRLGRIASRIGRAAWGRPRRRSGKGNCGKPLRAHGVLLD